MSGQRRANWETKLDAHRDVTAQALGAEALTRRNEVLALRERLDKLERDRTICVWAIAALLFAVGLMAVSR